MKREKRLTKRERKALAPPRPAPTPRASSAGGGGGQEAQHIHCIACGRHLDPSQFDEAAPTATIVKCQHGSQFAACVACAARAQELLDEHDRTGQPVKAAQVWH